MTGVSLVFTADLPAVRAALAQFMASPALRDLAAADRGTVELVLAEVLNNVAEHAYGGGGGPVKLDLCAEAEGIRCRVVDQGAAMPGITLPEGRLPRAVDGSQDLPEGGFGWFLIRGLTADLTYARRDGQNRLSFLIPLPAPG